MKLLVFSAVFLVLAVQRTVESNKTLKRHALWLAQFEDTEKKHDDGVIEQHKHYFHKDGEEDNNVYDHQHFHVHKIKTVKVEKTVPEPYPVFKKMYVPVKKIVEKEVKVPVEKEVRVQYNVPYKIPVPVPVPKPYPVKIEKTVPVPVEVKVPYKVPVKVEVPKPYPVKIEKKVPVPVPVEKPVPYPVHVEKKVPVPVKVNIPYPVTVEKKVPVPYYIRVPVHIEGETKPVYYKMVNPEILSAYPENMELESEYRKPESWKREPGPGEDIICEDL